MLSPIRFGDTGWRVYAVQRVLNIGADGNFGPATKKALGDWQAKHGLADDAIAGPVTQGLMLKLEAARVDKDVDTLPDGLLDGFAVYEGGNILAATNWYTPPGGKAGVDCGPVQWRLYGPPFTTGDLMSAFNPYRAFMHAAGLFSERVADYERRRPSLGRHRIVELAVLAHNAPFLADQVVRNGKLSTPSAAAVWTTKGSGSGHYTHAEWAAEYPRRILQDVTY